MPEDGQPEGEGPGGGPSQLRRDAGGEAIGGLTVRLGVVRDFLFPSFVSAAVALAARSQAPCGVRRLQW